MMLLDATRSMLYKRHFMIASLISNDMKDQSLVDVPHFKGQNLPKKIEKLWDRLVNLTALSLLKKPACNSVESC